VSRSAGDNASRMNEARSNPTRPEPVFEALFCKAKEKDEFEYACTLLRVRGLEDPGWQPLDETQALFDDLSALIAGPLRDDTRVRLALLLYCHLIEVDAIHEVLDNMVRVTGGGAIQHAPVLRALPSQRQRAPWGCHSAVSEESGHGSQGPRCDVG
jgi:hypothetical protein